MFRKIATLFCTAVALLLLFYANSAPVFSGLSDKFTVYCFSHSSNAQAVTVSDFSARFILSKTGESFSVKKGNLSPEEIFSRYSAVVIKTEETSEGISYFAFSSKIRYKKTVDGKTFNIQVFVGEKTVTVGTPMIYGSY